MPPKFCPFYLYLINLINVSTVVCCRERVRAGQFGPELPFFGTGLHTLSAESLSGEQQLLKNVYNNGY